MAKKVTCSNCRKFRICMESDRQYVCVDFVRKTKNKNRKKRD